MTSPICNVDGNSAVNAVTVTAGTTVTIALADTAGVTQWNLTCLTTDGLNTAFAINSALSINLINKTATLAVPVGLGSAFIFESKVNDGLDINGILNPTYTTTFKINVLTASGLPVTAFDEKMEQNRSYGWTEIINNMIRQYTSISGSSGAGLTGFYAVGQNADNSIVVNANDIQLKLTYQALLDGATSSATAGKLALRNGSGSCSFGPLISTTLAASSNVTVGGTLGVTGATTLSSTLGAGASTLLSLAVTNNATVGGTLGVTGATTLSSTLAAGASTLASLGVTGAATVGTTLGVTGATTLSSTLAAGASTLASLAVTGAATVGSTLAVTTSVTSPSHLFTSLISGVTKIVTETPSCFSGDWEQNGDGTWYNMVKGQPLVINLNPPQGCKITSIVIKFVGAGGHTFPIQNMPTFDFRKYVISSDTDSSIASFTDASGSAPVYQNNHNNAISGLTQIINKSTERYYLKITAESGTNSLATASVLSVKYTYDRLAGSSVGLD